MKVAKQLFPMFKEHYCENHGCSERHLMPRSKRLAFQVLMVARISFICISAALVGGAVHSFIFAQPTESLAQAILSERLTKNEVQVQMQAAEIALLRQTVAQQEKDISELHGIGIGLGSILIILQVIQMVAGRLVGLSTKKE